MQTSNPIAQLQLHVPVTSRPGLSFCDASAVGMRNWISELPRANIGETARLLYQCLSELNQLSISGNIRLQLLELLRPDVLSVCRSLERHFLNQSIVLSERNRKVASLCQALQNHLALGYKLAAAETAGTDKKQAGNLALALQRAIQSMFGLLVRACQLYCPVPEGYWLQLHLLHRVACQFGVENTPVNDSMAARGKTTSVQNTYVAALLMGCARTNQLRQNAIASLSGTLETWGSLVRLHNQPAADTLFLVSALEDAPARYRSLLKDPEIPGGLGMDASELLEQIHEYLQLPAEERGKARLPMAEPVSAELLEHLSSTWGDMAERTFRRQPGQGELELLVGMTAVHFHLAGRKAFTELLEIPEQESKSIFTEQKSRPAGADPWSNAFDAQPLQPRDKEALQESILYKPVGNASSHSATEGAEQQPAIHRLPVINLSPGGYCLSWPGEVPGQLQTGELLAIREPGAQQWSLAFVCWVRQARGTGTQMGIKLIAPNAQPCGLQLVRKGSQNSQYLRALLLPEIQSLSRPASLIAPHIPFRQGNKVRIKRNGVETGAQLLQPLLSTSSFCQYEYQLSAAPEQQLAQPPAADRITETPATEDFDSLWKSL
jgi:hypothetical protein